MKTKITLALLIAFSLITSFLAVYKVIAAGKSISAVASEIFQKDRIEVEEIERVDQESTDEAAEISPAITMTPSNTPKPTKTITRTPTPKPSPVALNTPTSIKSQPQNSSLCIVTLFGKQYDVTQLRSTHSGGDIFKCGTDQSALYQGKHGTNMSRMTAYLYDPNNPASGQNNPVPTGSSSNTKKDDDDDDREDSEHEDKYYENKEKQEEHEDKSSEVDD